MPRSLKRPKPPSTPDTETIARIQRGFEAALPKINEVIHFRLHGLPEQVREELSHEARAIAWANYRQLCLKGRSPEEEKIIQKIAEFAARHAYRGGHLAGSERINDAMSRSARIRRGVVVQSLSLDEDDPVHSEVLSSLVDRREASPVEEAIVRVDFPAWREGLTDTQKEIADDLTAGQNTADIGRKRGVSRTRIWQHREAMRKDCELLETGERER